VVALQWKWLFIYPEQKIASVNYVQFPEDTPVEFEITADAPMNSFWIPQLGGQVYAMPGMTTRLHLAANDPGQFAGSSANLSGEGFARMRFTAEATSQQNFYDWVQQTKQSSDLLDTGAYTELTKPSTIDATRTNGTTITDQTAYAVDNDKLYGTILMKYMTHGSHEKLQDHVSTPMTENERKQSHNEHN
jgi:cytochrome o ubiquinol oxidase subunit 2